ncbi:MAG: hypothetical protein ABL949_09460 [Fimbriimonadaceae bacterium]
MRRKAAWIVALLVACVGGWILMRGTGRVVTSGALLIGQWEESHSDGSTIRWEFSPDGSFSRTVGDSEMKTAIGRWSVRSEVLSLAFDSEQKGQAAGGARMVLSLESPNRGQIGIKGTMSPIRRL